MCLLLLQQTKNIYVLAEAPSSPTPLATNKKQPKNKKKQKLTITYIFRAMTRVNGMT